MKKVLHAIKQYFKTMPRHMKILLTAIVLLCLVTATANTVIGKYVFDKEVNGTFVANAKLADTFQVTVYTVGIGSNNAVVKQDGFFGSGFVPVQGEFDEQLLKDIAGSTGGVYYKADDGDSMRKAMEQIDKLEKTSVQQTILVNWKEFYPVLCWIAIGLLLFGMLLEKTVLLRIP